MLDAYTSAFARYLRTGTVGALSDFCDPAADLSRLRVYRNGFLRACIDALRANYPSVERLTGDQRFPTLARPYVEAHPPGTASLAEYGESFAQHVLDTRDMHGLDWLAPLAVLDRAWTEVYFSEDDVIEATPPADAEALVNLHGRLSPRVRLVSLEFPVLDIWSRIRQGEPAKSAEIRQAPQHVLVWRSAEEMLYRDLTLPEHAFISGVAAGRPCGEAAGAAFELDAGFDLVATFASLLHHHMLSFEH